MIVLTSGWLAAKSLVTLSPEPTVLKTVENPLPSSDRPSPPPSTALATPRPSDSLPIWSLGAIALSCTFCSLMISQRLSPKPTPGLGRRTV
ncbi:MAG TPA: hypothetical protein V6C88_13985 [Chroococcidiopsis sp.]